MIPERLPSHRALGASLAWLTAALLALAACTEETTPGDDTATGGSSSGIGGTGGSTSTGGAGSASGGAAGSIGAGTTGLGGAGSSSGGSFSGGTAGGGAGGSADPGGGAGAGGVAGTSGSAGAAGMVGGTAGNGGSAGGGAGAGGRGGAGAGGRGGGAGLGGSSGSGGRGGAGGGGAAGAGGTAGGSSYSPCPASGACKIMPFGDSITEGYPNGGGYRIELFRLAHSAGHTITFVGSVSNGPTMVDGVTFPRNHEGHGGYTISSGTNGIAQFVQPSLRNYTPHIITLAIGTNDLNGNIDVANAPMRLGALLDSIYTQNANVLVILAQIVPSQNDSLNQRVQTYNAAMPALVTAQTNKGRHIVLVDMYGAFTRDANYKTSLLGDNLHPNDAGYVRMGATWYAALSSYLH